MRRSLFSPGERRPADLIIRDEICPDSLPLTLRVPTLSAMKEDLEEIGRLLSRVTAQCGRAVAPYVEVALAIVFLIYGIAAYSWLGAGYMLLVVASCSSVALVRLRPSASAAFAAVSIVCVCALQFLTVGFGYGSNLTVFVVLLMLIVCFVRVKAAVHSHDSWAIRWARSYFVWIVATVPVGLSKVLAPLAFAFAEGLADASYLSSQALGIAFKVVGVSSVVSAVWLAGYVLRVRRERGEDAARQRLTDEQLRQADIELRVTKERDRIAQDVHDIMAHSLSVIVAQSDGARLIRERDSEAVDGALQEIATSARTSLTEVRMLIESLVNSPEGHSHPTLDNTDDLIERMRTAGLDVAESVYGEPFTLTPTQQLAVYRIVQEALTNALKHAGRDPQVRVAMDWRGTGLSLSIVSHGATTSDDSDGANDEAAPHGEDSTPGRGLYGMRERARLAGGWLTAGPDENGYVVSAYIPRQVVVDDDAAVDSIHSHLGATDVASRVSIPVGADETEAATPTLTASTIVGTTARGEDSEIMSNENHAGGRG